MQLSADYLEPNQTSKMEEAFCENSEPLKVIRDFCKKLYLRRMLGF